MGRGGKGKGSAQSETERVLKASRKGVEIQRRADMIPLAVIDRFWMAFVQQETEEGVTNLEILTDSIVEDTMAQFHSQLAEPAGPHVVATRPNTVCFRSSTPRPGPVGGGGR